MCRSVFDALDRQWAVLVHSPDGESALARWRADLELDADDLQGLVAAIQAGPAPSSNAALLVLARRAPTDWHAARTLLEALRPGLLKLGQHLAGRGSFDAVDHEIVSLAWERIRTYPADRRPNAVASNVLLDVRKRYVHAAKRDSAAAELLTETSQLEEDLPPAPSAEDDAIDAELASLRRAHARLAAAIDVGSISSRSAHVVWRSRVEQYDDAEIAAELGVAVKSLQRRRQRAERELARAS